MVNRQDLDGPRVAMRGIRQSFGGTTVLHDVDLTVAPGEIRAIIGQNGAGKSTLMKVLGGVYTDHEGTVEIDGAPVRMSSPRDAVRAGVGVIYQELSLIPELTVAENIVLGVESGGLLLDHRRSYARAAEVVSGVPMLAELPLDARVSQLNMGFRQRVEIAKALCRDARVLVLDEPTARLSGPEREDLRELIRQLASSGLGVIFISHFLEEVLDFCTALTVMRNGRVIREGATSEFTLESMTRLMLGAELALELGEDRTSHARDEAALILEGFTDDVLAPVNLTVRSGEVVGLAGLVGSGRSRLMRTIAAANQLKAGTITVMGEQVHFASPRHAQAHGIVLLPEERKTEGIVGVASAWHNIVMGGLDSGLAKFGFIGMRQANAAVRESFTNLQIMPNRPDLAVNRFSGGNQQKILIARALLAQPRVLLLDQPTAGVDVGTKAEIHRLINTTASEGTAVIVVSDDLDELLAVSDRTILMRAGAVVGEMDASATTRQQLVDALSADAPM